MEREHLTVLLQECRMVAVRSKTLEANVVVAHGPKVESHERAEAWWEALGEMLSAK